MIKVRYGCAVSSSACCRLLRVSGHTCAAFAPAQPVIAARGAPSPFLCYRKSKSVSLITIASLLRYPPYPRRLLWLILPSSLLVFQLASNPHILLVEPHYLIAHLCHIPCLFPTHDFSPSSTGDAVASLFASARDEAISHAQQRNALFAEATAA